VVAAVRTDFSVAAAQDGASTLLDATVSYDVGWDGLWTIAGVATGFNDARSDVTLGDVDLTRGELVIRGDSKQDRRGALAADFVAPACRAGDDPYGSIGTAAPPSGARVS
jgi:hypothetical protein